MTQKGVFVRMRVGVAFGEKQNSVAGEGKWDVFIKKVGKEAKGAKGGERK